MITVHHLENSRSQRVLWLLEELGLDYEIELYKRDPKTMLGPDSLRDVHPLGKSPVVVDGKWAENAERFWAREVAADDTGAEAWRRALGKCLRQLPRNQRDLIDQRYADNMSYQDMAALRESSEDSVKSLLRRIRMGLAKCIRSRLTEES